MTLHSSVPMREGAPQIIIQYLRADLEQPMGTRLGPPHLLLLDETLARHLVDRRFHKRTRNHLTAAIPFAILGNEILIGIDIPPEFFQRGAYFFRTGRFFTLHIHNKVIQLLQRAKHVAMPAILCVLTGTTLPPWHGDPAQGGLGGRHSPMTRA